MDHVGSLGVAIARKADLGDREPVHVSGQRRRRGIGDYWATVQPKQTTAKADGDAVAAHLAQRRPPNNQPTVMAGARERRAAFVAKPHARGSHSRQQPTLVEPFSLHLRDITNGMMHCRVIIEEYPRC